MPSLAIKDFLPNEKIMPSLEILLKNEFLPNQLYFFLVLLILGD
jgi:hypothetical protein